MKNMFKVDIPKDLVTRKARITYWILWHVYLTDLGRGHVFGKVTQLFTEFSLFLLVIDKLGFVNLNITHIFTFVCICVMLIWFSGWLYQHHNIDKIQQLVSTKRNPMIDEIYKKVIKNDTKRK